MRALLPVLIEDCDTGRFRAHAVVLRNWKAVRRLFEANRDTFEDPEKLKLAVANEELISRPIIRYQPPR
jgi:arsenate reductase-like glutaredoxin family protein